MNRKIPTKPFSAGTEKKATTEQTKRIEPNVSRSLPNTLSSNKEAAPSKTLKKPRGNRPSLLILLLIFTAIGAYLGYSLGNQYLNNSSSNRVQFYQTEYTYEVGNAGKLPVLVKGEYTSYNLFWLSSNAEIVEVDQGGNIFALAPGQVIITAAVGSGAIKDTVIINVVVPAD